MKKHRIITIIIAMTVLYASAAGALNLKMASLLPEGSDWDLSLKEMASDWKDITGGRVGIRIYPGGIAGSEADVIRKMRIGQIDMAVLTSIGMTAILPDSFAMSLPFFLNSEDELDFMVEEVSPIFDDAFREKGFIVLAWSKSGWVNIFSKQKILAPEDLARIKFAGSVTQPAMTEAFKKMGFNVIPVDTNDIMMGLQSGMIDSFYGPPMAAASYQWFGIANNMLDLKLSPVLGGIVISERAWNKIPEQYKQELMDSSRKMAVAFYEEAVELEEKSVAIMLKNGLQINRPDVSQQKLWFGLMGDDFSMLVGDSGLVSTETYNTVNGMLGRFRSR